MNVLITGISRVPDSGLALLTWELQLVPQDHSDIATGRAQAGAIGAATPNPGKFAFFHDDLQTYRIGIENGRPIGTESHRAQQIRSNLHPFRIGIENHGAPRIRSGFRGKQENANSKNQRDKPPPAKPPSPAFRAIDDDTVHVHDQFPTPNGAHDFRIGAHDFRTTNSRVIVKKPSNFRASLVAWRLPESSTRKKCPERLPAVAFGPPPEPVAPALQSLRNIVIP